MCVCVAVGVSSVCCSRDVSYPFLIPDRMFQSVLQCLLQRVPALRVCVCVCVRVCVRVYLHVCVFACVFACVYDLPLCGEGEGAEKEAGEKEEKRRRRWRSRRRRKPPMIFPVSCHSFFLRGSQNLLPKICGAIPKGKCVLFCEKKESSSVLPCPLRMLNRVMRYASCIVLRVASLNHYIYMYTYIYVCIYVCT